MAAELRNGFRMGTGIAAVLLFLLLAYLLFWTFRYGLAGYTFTSPNFWRIVLVFVLTLLANRLLEERPIARRRRQVAVFPQEMREARKPGRSRGRKTR